MSKKDHDEPFDGAQEPRARAHDPTTIDEDGAMRIDAVEPRDLDLDVADELAALRRSCLAGVQVAPYSGPALLLDLVEGSGEPEDQTVLLARDGVRPERLLLLGESLGGAVALELAVAHPPAGLVLQSTFTGIRAMARHHYPVLPRAAVPDAYPSLRLIAGLRAPLLFLHGDRDEIIPLMYGEALFEGAPEPKTMHVFRGVAHNDVLARAGREWVDVIARWAVQHAGS